MTYFVFVAGSSGSGKTTFANNLYKRFNQEYPELKVEHLSMDNYYQPRPSHIKTAEEIQEYRRTTNFDVPSQVDFDTFHTQLRRLLGGETIEVPIYSFVQSDRLAETSTMEPCDVIIIEGIFALYNLDKLGIDKSNYLSIFIEADSYLTYQNRRKIRDPLIRDMSAETVMAKELSHIRDSYFTYVRPSAQHNAELFISNNHILTPDSVLDGSSEAFEKDTHETVELILQRRVEQSIQHEAKHQTLFNLKNGIFAIAGLQAAVLIYAMTIPLSAPVQLGLAAGLLLTTLIVWNYDIVQEDQSDRLSFS